ncbi:MAG: PilZ domain-containing protein [Deltaproteobacteria bacterium]|nr:PilZ domain-containing protein [Deltaproteobacteria bacterium]
MPNRRFDRIQFESQARVKTGGQSFEASTENLSLNGLFIRTDKRLPVGNRAEILFVLPSASRGSEFSVTGEVVRNSNDGMAFQFGSLDQDAFSRLKTVINRKAPNRLKMNRFAQ